MESEARRPAIIFFMSFVEAKQLERSNMKKLKKQAVLFMTFLMFALSLIGCKENTEDVTSDTMDTQATEVAIYPLEITDSYGNVITIEEEPERVVSCAPNLTEMMYDLNAGDKLVGRSDYCDYPAQVIDIPSVGAIDMPDLESIIALEPDVVIATTFQEENIRKLKDVGIPVIVLTEDATLDGVYGMLESLGAIVNRSTEAEACINDMKETIATVEETVSGLDKPTVYYVMGYGEYGDFTAGGDTFVGEMIALSGGDNIAADISGWSITLEEIIEADPDIILISEYMKEDFINFPNYSELTAVKEGRVFTVDINIIERQGYRNAEGIKALATIFYPEEFK